VSPRPQLLLLALLLAAPAPARAEPAPGGLEAKLRGCRSRPGLGLLVSPRTPVAGQPLRVIVVSERPQPGARLLALGEGGEFALHRGASAGREQGELPLTTLQGGGPPWSWVGRLEKPAAGQLRFALLAKDGSVLACGRRRVESRAPKPAAPSSGEAWPARAAWSRYMENLYSTWIERLFDAPTGSQPSWTPLHLVIRDPARNILYNHLGASEDGPDPATAVVVQPDCADLPYFLRGYFAWKLSLPFGWRHCDRGSSTRPTKCESHLRTNLNTPPTGGGKTHAARFSRFIRQHVSLVHSGSGRTGPDDDETDLYPVPLSRAALRPGIVYVDPYGHLLVVQRWIEPAEGRGGILYAVDGHPDLSMGRKRFWRGAFLFSDKIQGGAGGFKAFRPLFVKGGEIVALSNEEINKHPDYRNHSAEQYRLGLDGFYDRMDSVITPRALPPLQAYRERLEALLELILERVGSVQAGEDFLKKTPREIAMPRGPKIFETSGAWEDFSTPARDLRLLIAIEEVLTFPARVIKKPGRFALGKTAPTDAKREMEQLLAQFSKEKRFTYKRSDGSDFTLTVGQLIERRKGLEVAYNPNDCPEIRWGASGSPELTSCRRRASDAQRQLMESYRIWFATRTRPPLR